MENERMIAPSDFTYESGRDFFFALSSEIEASDHFEYDASVPYIQHYNNNPYTKHLDLSESTNLKQDVNLCTNGEKDGERHKAFYNTDNRDPKLNQNTKLTINGLDSDAETSETAVPAGTEEERPEQRAVSLASYELDTVNEIKDILNTCLKSIEVESNNKCNDKPVEMKNNANPKEPFQCSICMKVISRKYNLNLHMMKHAKVNSKANSIECDICHKTFDPKRILTHMNVHLKPHACYVCGRGFRLLWDLKHHIYTHTGERPYPCDVCGKKFGDKSARRKHYQTHTGEKPYSCELCQKAFSQLSHLREHKVTHTREKSHVCELCGKKFTTKSSLQRHIFTHTNTCEVCNETFGSETNLSRHMELHNTERPYACTICDKRFIRRSDVYNHTKMHTAERNKFCKVCNQAFKSAKSLRIHHNNLHPDVEAPYVCVVCDKSFFLEHDYKQHLNLHEVKNVLSTE